MDGASIDYRVAGLRGARDLHTAAAAASAAVGEALGRAGLQPAFFGTVPAAAGFHAVAADVVSRQQADADWESARRADLADRVDRAERLGVRLIADTVAIARSVAPAHPDPHVR
jgi:hypothetical protein